ncbi:hypothetical protein T10_4870 [Trichinella papuae]|uniref:Uncharacterized protein n=1 Tax=Trichinella papuae TaxID=268474 RepID=A0A0V1N884_9BILA|nr:hypothetical protein T10_4870 [Trichinella papuae]
MFSSLTIKQTNTVDPLIGHNPKLENGPQYLCWWKHCLPAHHKLLLPASDPLQPAVSIPEAAADASAKRWSSLKLRRTEIAWASTRQPSACSLVRITSVASRFVDSVLRQPLYL